MNTKLCRKCCIEKSRADFNQCKSNKDGLQKYCRTCTRAFSRQNKERKALREGRTMKPYEEKKFSQVSDEALFMYLRKFTEEQGRPPTTADLEGNPDYPCAYTYYRRFRYKVKDKNKVDGWNTILHLAGIEPVDYFSVWRAWEFLVERAVTHFEEEYIFQCTSIHEGFRPDIVIESKKLIIDAVTSNYHSKIKNRQLTFAKKFGYTVEFWCLYKTTENGINAPHLKYVFAEEIIARLEAIGQNEISEKIKSIQQKYEQYCVEALEAKKEYYKMKMLELAELKPRNIISDDFIGNPGFPGLTSITKVFGSFTAALEYAGLPLNGPKRSK